MPTYIASTISPKWNTKRPAARALDGIHDVHDLDAGCRERVCVIESSVALWSRYAIQQEADRHSTLRGLSTAVGPRYVDSGQTKSGATHQTVDRGGGALETRQQRRVSSIEVCGIRRFWIGGSAARPPPPFAAPLRCALTSGATPLHDGPSAARAAGTFLSTRASALGSASVTSRQLSSRVSAKP